ncbi:MAG: Ribbon-helix-helix protein copG family [Bradyrhizobium sp.]|nr:Ribbon-helix-helix protein copG family [Bradyrhizobium sp.]
MNVQLHNTLVRFRANDALIASASERARADGMSLSEFLRQALRRELRNAA